jgi:hypothetical protein
LAITVSVMAVAIAAVLSSVGLSQTVIVLGVIVVGFATSWVRTGQVAQRRSPRGAHRVVTVPVRVAQF